MTNSPFIALERVSFQFANGRLLLDGLSEVFDARHTGLVGRNGVGKSLLGRLLAGLDVPTQGHISRQARVAYLPQSTAPSTDTRLIDLAGLAAPYAALQRVAEGRPLDDDIERLDGRWDIIERLQRSLINEGLGHLPLECPALALSGGERRRVALLGILLQDADLLILDEPSNHLDAPSRRRLGERLQHWPGGLVLISHDRELLAGMQRIVELSAQGLRSYGGNYAFYRDCRAHEVQAASLALEHARIQRKRGERELQAQQQRQQRRAASAERSNRSSNQAQILLDAQKNRSQVSAGRLQQRLQERREQLQNTVREATSRSGQELVIRMHGAPVLLPAGKRVLRLHQVQAPLCTTPLPDMELFGDFRLAISGANGCGKSSLLMMLAGRLQPVAGECQVDVSVAYLDQHLTCLEGSSCALDHLRRCNPSLDDALARTRLAHLGIDAERIELSCVQLSGGERLKLALAGVIAAQPAAPLLLLDEPDNHIDLDSLLVVERVLQDFHGALAVVSHDQAFIAALGITDRLSWTDEGWSHQCTGST